MKHLLLLLSFLSFLHASLPLINSIERVETMIANRETGAYLNFSDTDVPFVFQDFLSPETNILTSHTFSYRAMRDLLAKRGPFELGPYGSIASALFSTPYRFRCLQLLELLKQNNEVLLFTDRVIPEATQDLLFGPSSQQMTFFSQNMRQVEKECCRVLSKDKNYKVVVLVMDKMNKLLAKKLVSEVDSIFLLDLSHLQGALSEWNLSDWKSWMLPPPPPIARESGPKILFTSALIPYKFEERKQEYIHSLKILDDYGYHNRTFVVESTGYSPLSFFSEHSPNVFYSNTNDTSYINKGVNEAKAMIAALDYYNFDDEEMIIKMTGRYFFNNNSFLQNVESHPEVDAFAIPWISNDLVMTGCFAMRCKYMKRMLKELDFDSMEKNLIDIERLVWRFLQKMVAENANVQFLNKIGLTANVANYEVQQW